MRILAIFGSPRRNGNSRTMAEALLARAEALGEERGEPVEVERVFLNALEYKGCQHCDACKGVLDGCALGDDLAPVLRAARECDVLLLATPVYYGEVSAQLKGFIDRTYSFLVPGYARAEVRTRLAPGKRLVMVVAQGHPKEDLFADIFPRYAYFFLRYHLFEDARLVRACGVYSLGDAAGRAEALALAEREAQRLFEP
jgi:multimeric flavodoxin WrbA